MNNTFLLTLNLTQTLILVWLLVISRNSVTIRNASTMEAHLRYDQFVNKDVPEAIERTTKDINQMIDEAVEEYYRDLDRWSESGRL